MAKAELELRGDASSVLAGMGRARRVVLRHQLEVAEEMGHAFVEVPTDLLRELLGPVDVPPVRRRAFGLVSRERDRQDVLGLERRAAGVEWRNIADVELVGGDDRRVVIVGEEFGEVCRALFEGNDAQMEREIVHVAACAVGWLESRGVSC